MCDIQRNAYNNENIGYISENYIDSVTLRGVEGVCELCTSIWMNHDHPENWTVLPNRNKRNELLVYVKPNWHYAHAHITVNDMTLDHSRPSSDNHALVETPAHVGLREFGKENTSYITEERLLVYLGNRKSGLVDYFKDIYCNPDHPENWNLMVTNVKDKTVMTYTDKRWQPKHGLELIYHLPEWGGY